MLPVLSPKKGALWRVIEEKIMSRKSFIVAVVVCGAALAQSIPAVAGGVTDADLRGKKICWNNGNTSTYNKDGSFDSNRVGHGTWRLNGDVVTISAEQWSGANTISKDGNGFHSVRRASKSGADIEAWGNYCN
jgi:hypothetical protein